MQIAKHRIGRRTWLTADAEDLASYAIEKLAGASKRGVIQNEEAWLSAVIRNRVIDLAIRRDAELARLVLVQDELPIRQLAGGQSEPREFRRQGAQLRGLSVNVIEKEERDMARLLASAIIAAMPDAWDRAVLSDRFYASASMSITELAKRHGNTPNVMANYLVAVLGTPQQPGAVRSVATLLEQLSQRQSEAYVRLLVEHEDDLAIVTDPFGAARGHLELASRRSRQHQSDARLAISRLTWLQNHLPNARGRANKVLRRLTLATCLYIIEEHDANNDLLDPRGLSDDVAVLNAARIAISRHAN